MKKGIANNNPVTEAALKEQRLSLLDICISNLNDIVLITEGDPISELGPRIVFVNEAFERITGYTSPEALGRNPRFLQGPRTDPFVLAEIREALIRHQPIRRNLVNYGKDGREYILDIDIAPIFDDNGLCTHFVAIERDVTREKEDEKSLLLFRNLTNYSSDAIEVVDPDTGQFLHVNDTACGRLGYSREEMLALRVDDVFRPNDKWFSFRLVVEELKKKGREIVQGRHVRKDGSSFPIEANVRYVELDRGYLITVVRDITDRKQAEARISEQAALLNEAQDAIMVRDLFGKILFWNKGAERIYGWTSEEVLGRDIGELFHNDPNTFREINQKAIEEGGWNGEIHRVTKDRRQIIVAARWTIIRDDDGNPKSILAINTDVTEKKKIENQFMRAQRMDSLGTLAGGIAHDLNNILGPILLSIELLKMNRDPSRTANILSTIELSAKRGADIVQQILSFARGMEGDRIKIEPEDLLRDLEKILRDTLPKNIQLLIQVPKNIWPILGDPTQVHQILLNLCVNARDAMPKGGIISINLANSVLDKHYTAMNSQGKPGRYVCLEVIDTGKGIPPDLLDKIFEPFFTTKKEHEGTGLGLSTVMAIVKGHEGLVDVSSELDQGTTFKVYLPAMAASQEKRKSQPIQPALLRGKGELILVIDDENSILNITGQTLEAFGYRVITAVNGAEGVARYAEYRQEVAVVLTDMMMPVMDGSSTIQSLMRLDPLVKIIATSGLKSNTSMSEISRSKIKHFLKKPYTANTLLTTLRSILDEA